jgi:uncharacterized membrane protein
MTKWGRFAAAFASIVVNIPSRIVARAIILKKSLALAASGLLDER